MLYSVFVSSMEAREEKTESQTVPMALMSRRGQTGREKVGSPATSLPRGNRHRIVAWQTASVPLALVKPLAPVDHKGTQAPRTRCLRDNGRLVPKWAQL